MASITERAGMEVVLKTAREHTQAGRTGGLRACGRALAAAHARSLKGGGPGVGGVLEEALRADPAIPRAAIFGEAFWMGAGSYSGRVLERTGRLAALVEAVEDASTPLDLRKVAKLNGLDALGLGRQAAMEAREARLDENGVADLAVKLQEIMGFSEANLPTLVDALSTGLEYDATQTGRLAGRVTGTHGYYSDYRHLVLLPAPGEGASAREFDGVWAGQYISELATVAGYREEEIDDAIVSLFVFGLPVPRDVNQREQRIGQNVRFVAEIARLRGWDVSRTAKVATLVDRRSNFNNVERELLIGRIDIDRGYKIEDLAILVTSVVQDLNLDATALANLVNGIDSRDHPRSLEEKIDLAGRVSGMVRRTSGGEQGTREAARVSYAMSLIQAWGLAAAERQEAAIDLARRVSSDLSVSEAASFANALGANLQWQDERLTALLGRVADRFAMQERRTFLAELVVARQFLADELGRLVARLIQDMEEAGRLQCIEVLRQRISDVASRREAIVCLIRTLNVTPQTAAGMIMAGSNSDEVLFFASAMLDVFSQSAQRQAFFVALDSNLSSELAIRMGLRQRFGPHYLSAG